MRVWVNTAGGWIQHGGIRVSAERAAKVAAILANRHGWETASGDEPPAPRPAGAGAPSPAVAAKSPSQAPRVTIGAKASGAAETTGSAWSQREVEAVVEDYFDMLEQELKGERVNKADHNRRLQALLPGRSHGSVEFKHQNISAVLLDLGHPPISGYKPRGNYQDLLATVVAERVAADGQLMLLTAAAVEAPVEVMPEVDDLLSLLVKPPIPPAKRETYEQIREGRSPMPVKVNWLERESRNRSLATAGEQLALEFEHRRLWKAKRRDLAEKVEHLSNTKGDGLGYDILSFEANGDERLIEVKTTGFGPMTPFFASRNEVAVSEERANAYVIYRLFAFRKEPRMFHLHGSLRTTCILEPVQYAASVA